MNKKVQEQFERTKRWHARFKEINDGRDHNRESDYYKDTVYAFFQNCWHLKDWIQNSDELGADKTNELVGWFHGHTDMLICRDIANGSKHLLIKDPSIDKNISIGKSQYSLSLGGPPKIQVVYWIQTDKHGSLNAFDLADTLIANVEGQLKKYGLLD